MKEVKQYLSSLDELVSESYKDGGGARSLYRHPANKNAGMVNLV